MKSMLALATLVTLGACTSSFGQNQAQDDFLVNNPTASLPAVGPWKVGANVRFFSGDENKAYGSVRLTKGSPKTGLSF